MADFNLGVALNADPSGFNSAMDNAAKKSADSFALIYDTAKQYLGMAGVAGTFARAADAAGKFYQAVADIGAISGQPLENVDKLLLDIDSRISTALGSANTMYEVFSSGIDGTNKEIAELTEIIGKTANVIRADIVSTGDAMTTIMNAWGISATDAKDIMDGLFITVREGKAHGDELARTFGLVTATASAMGTELDDLFAAVAILSRTQSSSQSMIGLNQMLNAIIKPTMEARAAAKKWGVEISATAIQTKGLAGVLRELRDKVGGNVEALEAMFGNIRAGRAVLALTGTQFDEYIKVLDQMRGKSGSAEEAFKKQMNTMRAETERFKNEVTKAFITVGKDTEVVTTTLAQFGSSLLESFRSSSSGIGDFVSDINDVLGTTKKIPEELDKQIKYFSRWTLYLMGALRAYKGISDHFTKISSTLANIRGDMGGPTGGGDGKAPKTPRTPTSRFAKDTVAIDATDAALKRMTTTITTQVSPAIRGLSDAFVSIKESVKAIATEVITLDDKINTAKAATSGFATAVTGLKTALSDVSKLASAITTEMTAAGSAVTSTNLGLKLTLSNLAAIRVEQALVNAGYAAHTASIAATNHALTQQIALLQTSRAMFTGGMAGTTGTPSPATATKGQSLARPAGVSATTATHHAKMQETYEDRLYRDYVNKAIPNYSYENQLEREFFFGAGPEPKAVNNKRYTQRDSKGRFVNTIFPALVSGGAISLEDGFANATNISTAPTSATPQPTGTKIPWRSSASFMLAPAVVGGSSELSDGFTGPKIPASRLKQRIPNYPGLFSTYPVGPMPDSHIPALSTPSLTPPRLKEYIRYGGLDRPLTPGANDTGNIGVNVVSKSAMSRYARELSKSGKLSGALPAGIFPTLALKTPLPLSTGPYAPLPSIYRPLESSKMPGVPYAPGTDGFKAFSRMERDGIKIKNTGDIAKSITNATARMPGVGGGGGSAKKFSMGDTGMEKAFNVLLAIQVAQMGYQFGKALDERFGVSDKASDRWTGAGVMRAQQTAEGMQAQAANTTRIIERDLASPTGPKLNVIERMELQKRVASAPNEETRIAINNEYLDLINQRTTPAEERSEQLKLAQDAVDAAKKDLEEFRERMKTAPLSIATPSRTAVIGSAIDRYTKEQEIKELRKDEPISFAEAMAYGKSDATRFRNEEKEQRIKERSDAIQMLQKAVTGDDFGKLYTNVKAGDFEAAGLGGYSKYQQQVVKDIITGAEFGAVDAGEIFDIEKALKNVEAKSTTDEQRIKFVNKLDEYQENFDNAMRDFGLEMIDQYEGFGSDNFTEATMDRAQGAYGKARETLDLIREEYNRQLKEWTDKGMKGAELESNLTAAKDRLNAAFAKMSTAEKGVYDSLAKWQANLGRTILEAAERASGLSPALLGRADIRLGARQLMFTKTARLEAAKNLDTTQDDLATANAELEGSKGTEEQRLTLRNKKYAFDAARKALREEQLNERAMLEDDVKFKNAKLDKAMDDMENDPRFAAETAVKDAEAEYDAAQGERGEARNLIAQRKLEVARAQKAYDLNPNKDTQNNLSRALNDQAKAEEAEKAAQQRIADAKKTLDEKRSELATAEENPELRKAVKDAEAALASAQKDLRTGRAAPSENLKKAQDIFLEAQKELQAAQAAVDAAPADPNKAADLETKRKKQEAAEKAFNDARDQQANYEKSIAGQRIGIFQMQMERADIGKEMGKIGGVAYRKIQQAMLKNIEMEAKKLYNKAVQDYQANGENSIFTPTDIAEFATNLDKATLATRSFAKSMDFARDMNQQGIMGGVQSLSGMKDPRGDLTATSLYHSINFMARLAPPERLLGSPTMPTGAVPEALNFKNAADAQAGVARALDAYIMSQQYRQAGLATTVENIYSTLRSGSSIVVR